jgi:exopolysaccharide biosynthesis polyprenyl glycosylphosphotransferase
LARIAYTSAADAAQPRETFQDLLLHQPARPAVGARARLRGRRLACIRIGTLFAGALAGATVGLLAEAAAVLVLVAAAAYAVAWLLLGTIFGICADDDARPWSSTLQGVRRTVFVGLAISWPTAGALALADAHISIANAIVGAAVATALTIAVIVLTQALVYRSRRRQRTVIIGSGVVAGHVVERIEHSPHLSLEPIGLVDDDVHDELSPELPRLGRLEDLESVVRAHDVDRVIVAFSRSGHDELLRCIRVCWDNDVAIDIVPRLFEFLDGARAVDRVGGLPLLSITAPQLSPSAQILKRATDVFLSVVGLLFGAPVLGVVAFLIKLDSRGPVFFAQVRVGRDGGPFRIYKFRSMYADADARKQEYIELNDLGDGVMFKIHDDPRITRIGRFIRRLSIDELPQLFNVLRGDMSLVGPRPLIETEAAAFSKRWHERRLDLRPGMTGLWQIYGRSTIPFQDMLRFDYQYVANWSLARDLEIMLLTLPAMLSTRGAY